MTGQVKEDILCRFGELGVFVSNGNLLFNPRLLRREEFLGKPTTFEYLDINKMVKQIDLEEGTLAFTYCQVPVIYKLSNRKGLSVKLDGQEILEYDSLNLNADLSSKVFRRTGEITQITVSLEK